jgi:OmpA-OmpF porin, OOP family
MKSLIIILTSFFIFSISSFTSAQFDFGEKIKKKIEKKAESEIDKTIDKGIDETVDAVKKGGKEEDKEKDTKSKSVENSTNESKAEQSSTEQGENQELKIWSKYDFVAGEKVIFEDNLTGEESGEFPSRWDLISGSAQNASLGNDNVIQFVHTNTIVLPLMDKKDFLPDVFTVEFDVFFEELATKRSEHYQLRFFEGRAPTARGNKKNRVIEISWNKVMMGSFGGETTDFGEERKNWLAKWKHIAISFNERSLKLYMDQERILNIPNLGFKPEMFSIGGQFDERFIKICAIKNIRVNEGGKKLYDRIMAEGKFVTHGILFDVNKSAIKGESMGTINEIVELMKEHPDLKFSIEGHTDSDGEESFNQKLSEERAMAVKTALVESGIDQSRLETKGWGETKPLNSNSTPEEKSNNRRVEFIKI